MKNAACVWSSVTVSGEESTSFLKVDLSLLAGVVIFVLFGETSL